MSFLSAPATEFVRAAHAAGFAAVGLRPFRVTESDPEFPTDTGSPAFRELMRVLDGTGTRVLDIEVLSVTPGLSRDDWRPGLEAGAVLGAAFVNIVGDDPSSARFADTVGRITEDARSYGLLPVLEPVAYRPFRSYELAFEIAADAGCGVELDVLHFLRTGATIETIERHSDLIPIVQICDAPATLDERAAALRSHARGNDPISLAIAESRSHRLLPGDGDAPIADLLDVIDPTTPISVEIPRASAADDAADCSARSTSARPLTWPVSRRGLADPRWR